MSKDHTVFGILVSFSFLSILKIVRIVVLKGQLLCSDQKRGVSQGDLFDTLSTLYSSLQLIKHFKAYVTFS